MALADRFWPKVQKGDACWFWLAAHDQHGYGHIQRGGRDGGLLKAHRVAYELIIGPIPEGLELDHLCRVPACVNPAHLEPVTHLENMRRGKSATSPVCRKGHPWTPENTTIIPQGTRLCRACSRDRWNRVDQKAKYWRRKREKYGALPGTATALKLAEALGVSLDELLLGQKASA